MVKVLLDSAYLDEVVKQIRAAETGIWVAMFEWSWYPGQHTGSVQDINRELCTRAKNGIDVRVLLHNEAMGRALHKINRVTAGHLKQSKAQVKWGNTGAALHAKVWIFDKTRVIMGSHNISARAVRTNVECSVLLQDDVECSKVMQWFERLWAKGM